VQFVRFHLDFPLTSTHCVAVYSVWDLTTRKTSTIQITTKMPGEPAAAAAALFTVVAMPTAMCRECVITTLLSAYGTTILPSCYRDRFMHLLHFA